MKILREKLLIFIDKKCKKLNEKNENKVKKL